MMNVPQSKTIHFLVRIGPDFLLGKERRFQESKRENRIAGLPLTHLQNKCFETGALLMLKVGSLGLLEWKGAGSTGV